MQARMRDVLGTIQSDQDAIIRAGSGGALVVDGGPGTGGARLGAGQLLERGPQRQQVDRVPLAIIRPARPHRRPGSAPSPPTTSIRSGRRSRTSTSESDTRSLASVVRATFQPPDLADDQVVGHEHVVEEDLVEQRVAGQLPQRPHVTPGEFMSTRK